MERQEARTTSRRCQEVDRYIGDRLREARRLRGRAMEALSRQLAPPVTYQQLQKYESGTNRVPAVRLWQIARLLGLPIGYFLPPGDDAAEGLPPLTAREERLIEAFRRLPEHRQDAVRVVVGSMAAADAAV